ncbi:LLM class flavin-dependent oxidoreductase [Streptomyces sp. KAI-26]|uniref:LLM class flavin-dependent oxidoreductase n=1 Tax=Streptomyces sp. KAI-26 TaxID=1169747 RepID=UPI0015871ED8|nr:LLM class flavin-dependent oxidoreductase [Streptomyces sp. KAI-26]NUV87809.1 LLM class flavin-dependent oxidoreductase [Streptomyces sp. KAI-26]NUW20259.1 LLM class flavin-dependent oxidoreductase [Streptomyces roseoviolaceus]
MSPRRTGTLHLNAFLHNVGHHEAAWRLPESNPRADTDIAHYKSLAVIAERGRFDSIFLADNPKLTTDIRRRPAGTLEPTVMLTALAGATTHIGLIATASTTYNDPYNLARRFASVDHISGGRVGWNIVTSSGTAAARNFGLDESPSHQDRYLRAAEFVDVALRLWDSWEDDTVIADKERGVWGDQTKIHPASHSGEFFHVAGALNVPRCPQGRPLLVQAGSSQDGRAFAARYAEAVFTAQQTLEEAQHFYADMSERLKQAGRDSDAVKILPGLVPVVGATEREARDRADALDRLILPEYAKLQLASRLRLSPDELHMDRELPAHLPDEDEIEDVKSRFSLIVSLARRESLTVRQLISKLGPGRGHRTVAGIPEQIADSIQLWFDSRAADGFNLMPAVMLSGLEDFVDQVVPILQDRGIFRREYKGETLRDHYALPRPANRYLTDRRRP